MVTKQRNFLSALTVIVILIVMVTFLFNGCEKESKTSTSKKVKITMMNSKNEIQTVLEDGAKDFQKKYPNIELSIILCPAGQSPLKNYLQ